jgi:hypothetical protein
MRHAFSNSFKYIAFCDQDDIWDFSRFDFIVSKHELGEPVLYTGVTTLIDLKGNECGQVKPLKTSATFGSVLFANPIPGNSMILNRALVKEILELDSTWTKYFLHDHFAMLIAVTKGRHELILEPFTYYRQHLGNAIGYESRIFKRVIRAVSRSIRKDGYSWKEAVVFLSNNHICPDRLETASNFGLLINSNVRTRYRFVRHNNLIHPTRLENQWTRFKILINLN